MEQIDICCTNIGRTVSVPVGLSVAQLAETLGVKLRYTIIGAVVNNKCFGLTYRIYEPKQITFFDITHPEGRRTYIRSLVLMLYTAVSDVLPGSELNVLHSVSKGLYCELKQGGKAVEPTQEQIDQIKARMAKLCADALPITRQMVTLDEAVARLAAMEDTCQLLKQHGDVYVPIHTLCGKSAALYGDLVPNTSIVDVYDLCKYYTGMLLRLPDDKNPEQVAPMTTQSKMFDTFIAQDEVQNLLDICRLADLNQYIEEGNGRGLIQVAEALHEKNIAKIADMIAQRSNKVKVVLIAGPSSSGKTTFSKRLAVQLHLNGIVPVNLSIDNYFVNRVDTPRDADGNYDFETVDAIDVKLFNQQLLDLMAGKEIDIPKYNFIKGEREYDGTKLKLAPNSVVVIEGTHGLTPALTPNIPAENKFRIYIAPLAGINFDHLTRIQTTDNRLIRRIVRDYYNRGHNADATIAMWPSVRRGEDRFIYANQEEADVMFNSCTIYELAVLKAKAEPILLEVRPNSPNYAEAQRLLRFLSYFKPLDSATVPPTSLLREFVGGSSFNYD